MKLNRRFLLAATISLLAIHPGSTQMPNKKSLVFVGTYTDNTESKGIYAFDFDAFTGKLYSPRPRRRNLESLLDPHPSQRQMGLRRQRIRQTKHGQCFLHRRAIRQAHAPQPTPLPGRRSLPPLAFDKSGKYLFAANYTSGHVAVFPILAMELGQPTAVVKNPVPSAPTKNSKTAPTPTGSASLPRIKFCARNHSHQARTPRHHAGARPAPDLLDGDARGFAGSAGDAAQGQPSDHH